LDRPPVKLTRDIVLQLLDGLVAASRVLVERLRHDRAQVAIRALAKLTQKHAEGVDVAEGGDLFVAKDLFRAGITFGHPVETCRRQPFTLVHQ